MSGTTRDLSDIRHIALQTGYGSLQKPVIDGWLHEDDRAGWVRYHRDRGYGGQVRVVGMAMSTDGRTTTLMCETDDAVVVLRSWTRKHPLNTTEPRSNRWRED